MAAEAKKPTFATLQTAFANAVIDASVTTPPDVTSHTACTPTRRFNVYRNNVAHSLSEALVAQFPATHRLLGDEAFRAVASLYLKVEPPKSPVLLLYGRTFPDFLLAQPELDAVSYVADVARLEWLWSHAYHAADVAPLPADTLAAIPPEHLADTHFAIHPSVGLVNSAVPVVSIWETNRQDETVQAIDLSSGGEEALVCRPAYDVEVHRLPPGTARLIDELGDGRPLGAAAEAAASTAAAFSPADSLTALLRSRIITQSW